MPPSSLEKRIQALENRSKKNIGQEKVISDDLLQLYHELHPATALSHQSQVLAPIIYRKQAVLACKSKLKDDMRQCQEILQLLLIGQSETKNITEGTVVNAPILMTNATVAPTTMDATAMTIIDLQCRTNEVSQKLDRIIRQYQTLIGAVSETLALAREKVRLAEEK